MRVEFYGIPRERAGVAATTVEGATLGDALIALAKAYPKLAESCFDGPRLRSGYVANINGDRFTTDPRSRLQADDSLLILSADAGG